MFMLFKFLVLFSVFSESGSGYVILLLVRGLQYPSFTVNAGICNIVYIYIYISHCFTLLYSECSAASLTNLSSNQCLVFTPCVSIKNLTLCSYF